MPIRNKITNIVTNHILYRFGNHMEYANTLLASIRLIVNNGYPFQMQFNEQIEQPIESDIQESLAKVNEKETRRKKEGVYYTGSDATDFIAANAFVHYVKPEEHRVFNYKECIKKLCNLSREDALRIINSTVFDPTCGTGEFLISAFKIKIAILCHYNFEISPVEVLSTFSGNDIELTSCEITKLRMFFCMTDSFDRIENLHTAILNINANFTHFDMVAYDGEIFENKDIILGNPPYVEYRSYNGETRFQYGNVYADVLHNSVNLLTMNGVMAFVVPLSYVSTLRMSPIRNYLLEQTNKQVVLNYADRPDSLFSSVHQKLTIVLAQRGEGLCRVYSSSYQYWYKAERENLFNNITLSQIPLNVDKYWPKIGNGIELKLYNKFLNLNGVDLTAPTLTNNETRDIYINQRGCFWMKVFNRDMNSESYMKYSVPVEIHPFVYCLLNSSLFFLLWIIISDGWHITKKEMSFIKLPNEVENIGIWIDLMNRLENNLENTKEFVGTKQVEYEYKHKFSKNIIDEIDDELSNVYDLSFEQVTYIKNFGLKYRLSDGASC